MFGDGKETSFTPRLSPELRLKLAARFFELVGIVFNSKQAVSFKVVRRHTIKQGTMQSTA